MLEGLAFLSFGFLAALAYLAYHQERDLVAYGLGGLGLACALWGVELLIDAGDGDSGAAAFETIIAILRFIAMGIGFAFLAFTGAIEGRRYFLVWKARRDAELENLRAGLRLEARKDAETRTSAAR
jgi:hypothetical protein